MLKFGTLPLLKRPCLLLSRSFCATVGSQGAEAGPKAGPNSGPKAGKQDGPIDGPKDGPKDVPKDGPKPGQILCRDYVSKQLHRYYSSDSRVSSLPPFDIRNYEDESELKQALQAAMQQKGKARFVTAVEIFRPYYSQAIANWMLKTLAQSSDPLVIYEIGAGSGINAKCILEYLRDSFPEKFKTVEYTIIDFSKLLTEQQRSVLAEFKDKVKIFHTDVQNWQRVEKRKCFVVMLEILDNLPHDEVVMTKKGLKHKYIDMNDKVSQSILANPTNKLHQQTPFSCQNEFLYDITDNYVQQYLSIIKPVMYPGDSVFIPTVCMKVLHIFRDFFPNHHLMAVDFRRVTGAEPGKNAPYCVLPLDQLSQFLEGNTTGIDVHYPTNFEEFTELYTSLTGRPEASVLVEEESDFLQRYVKNVHKITFRNGQVGYVETTSAVFTS